MKKIKVVTISRKRWGINKLRTARGKQCCLGFCGEAAGIPPKGLSRLDMPHHVSDKYIEQFEKAFPMLFLNRGGMSSDLAYALAEINDDEKLASPDKEKALNARAKQHRLAFRFVD